MKRIKWLIIAILLGIHKHKYFNYRQIKIGFIKENNKEVWKYSLICSCSWYFLLNIFAKAGDFNINFLILFINLFVTLMIAVNDFENLGITENHIYLICLYQLYEGNWFSNWFEWMKRFLHNDSRNILIAR